MMERLLEVVLVEAVRHAITAPGELCQGLLAGLANPQIVAALKALHDDPGRSWSVARLAEAARMSRSVFAARFSAVIGISPIDYLLQWRMAIAQDMLRRGGTPLAEIAAACGYRSVSAFSVAFHRTVGCPPSRFAKA